MTNQITLRAKIVVFVLGLLLGAWMIQRAEGQDHSKQPATCDNFFKTEHKCACNKATDCPKEGEKMEPNNKCGTYCRPTACKCSNCET